MELLRLPKSAEEKPSSHCTDYGPEKKRWFILLIVALLNLSNAMMWISFAPITNFADEFYCEDGVACEAGVWLSLIFMILYVPIGLLAIWGIDTFGLRPGILIGSWLNVIGGFIRVTSSLESVPQSARFSVVMAGQSLAAAAQPFILVLPTKLAAQWFPDNQRAIANTVGSMCNQSIMTI